MIANFGPKAILINPMAFLNKIDKAFKEQKIEYQADKISYEDLSINRMERIEGYRVPTTTPLFTKDVFFNYQREYRIVLLNKRVEKSYTANIGKLNDRKGIDDTAFSVMDTMDFFSDTILDVLKRS